MDQTAKRMQELRRELSRHAELYYRYDSPEISDYEYDMLYAELLRLEAEDPEYFDPASPSQRVGGKPLDKFEKVVHAVRMDSLSDVFSFSEVEEFCDRMAEEIKYLAMNILADTDNVANPPESAMMTVKLVESLRESADNNGSVVKF